jgi:hypothetical protein
MNDKDIYTYYGVICSIYIILHMVGVPALGY